MGLDVTLGILVLIGGIRGWVRGFLLQAVRVAALVSCVYIADPARDLARPLAQQYIPGIRPEVLDRLLWWSSAVISFVVMSGIGSILVKVTRRRPYGEREPSRSDQHLGFAFGAAKAALVMCFLVAAIAKYGPEYAPKVGDWAVEQVKTSQALVLSNQYRPADQIWHSVPVQHFVSHVRERGLMAPVAVADPAPAAPERRAETAATRQGESGSKSLALPRPRPRDLDDEIARVRDDIQRTQLELQAARKSR
jgi:uncharacterized membrane protein required for colicin V production